MMRRKVIAWSPHNASQFVVAAADLRLYEILDTDAAEEDEGLSLRAVRIVSVNPEVQNLRCLAWSPGPGLAGAAAAPSLSSRLLPTATAAAAAAAAPPAAAAAAAAAEASASASAAAAAAAAAVAAGEGGAAGTEGGEATGVLAAGMPSGKVLLAAWEHGVPKVVREFVPQHQRACNALAWNRTNPALLAAGLDKVRADCSLQVWDVTCAPAAPSAAAAAAAPSSLRARAKLAADRARGRRPEVAAVGVPGLAGDESQKFSIVPLMHAVASVRRPYVSLCNNEATMALAWLPGAPHCIAAGTGAKLLRIFDLRRDLSSTVSISAHSKAVLGVEFDPFHDQRMLTFSEDGQIKIWDIRQITQKPIFTMKTGSKGLQQVSWCPTRAGVIGSIARDETSLKLWDLKDSALVQRRLAKPHVASIVLNKAVRTHHTNDALACISWHPDNEFRLLSVSTAGLVELVELHESLPLAVSARSDMTFGYGKRLLQCGLGGAEEDVSVVMRRRAADGFSMDLELNFELALAGKLSEQQRRVTEWMLLVGRLLPKFQGLLALLRSPAPLLGDKGAKRRPVGRQRASGGSTWPFPPLFESPQRQAVLQVCGWEFASATAFDEYLRKLAAQGEHTRACAIAVFMFDVPRAIAALQQGFAATGETTLQLVAMALAGFAERTAAAAGPESMGIWQETASAVVDRLECPYLSVCFRFLCSSQADILRMVTSSQMRLNDRAAFACRFLPDAELLPFMEAMEEGARLAGDLEGLAVTGLSTEGIELLQHYIDNTGDVQTAALVMAHVVPSRFHDARVSHWVNIYRDLLDAWEMWHERARLDIAIEDFVAKPPQLYARCNFCSQDLSLGQQRGQHKGTAFGGRRPGERAKMNGCPSCRKPMPRCAVCLLPLNHSRGAEMGGRGEKAKRAAADSAAAHFGEWFSWCQSCHHGGHSDHTIEWFATHTHCPVTDCSCPCATL